MTNGTTGGGPEQEPNWYDDADPGESGWHYRHPDRLLGALQRGHGAGALRAAADPVAADLVHACIRTDHRWWQLIDEREVYLARLVRDLRMDTAPVLRWLWTRDRAVAWSEEGAGFELAAGVLTELALAGDAGAEAHLLRYVRTGRRWAHVLHRIAARWPVERWDGLRDRAADRLLEDVPDPLWLGDDPWWTWAPDEESAARNSARLRPTCEGNAAGRGTPAADLDAAHLSDLLATWSERVRSGAWCGFVPLADALARRGPAAREALPALRFLWKSTPHSAERPAVLRALLAVDPAGSRPVLVQGLWDCESAVRLLATAHAPLDPRTTARLTALAADPIETAEIRRTAAARLAATAP